MNRTPTECQAAAAAITRAASKQTYYTIKWFVDRALVHDAYLAYGYFRWVDDILDSDRRPRAEKISFIERQKHLLEISYRGGVLTNISLEEQMLVELVQSDTGGHPGLHSYLMHMMSILEFDARRQDQWITQGELSFYSQGLAIAVTDALHYFIGNSDHAPQNNARYLAVSAAHITHMLRDTMDDLEMGYFNIPREYLAQKQITPKDVNSPAYFSWICSRVELAGEYFRKGRQFLAQDKNFRRRLVGYAYSARFEWMLHTIKRENYCLRSEYRDRKGVKASLWMIWNTVTAMFTSGFTARSPEQFIK